jgi:hypothetical protein
MAVRNFHLAGGEMRSYLASEVVMAGYGNG